MSGNAQLEAQFEVTTQELHKIQDEMLKLKANLLAITRLAGAMVFEAGGTFTVGAKALAKSRSPFNIDSSVDPEDPTKILVVARDGVPGPRPANAARSKADPVMRPPVHPGFPVELRALAKPEPEPGPVDGRQEGDKGAPFDEPTTNPEQG